MADIVINVNDAAEVELTIQGHQTLEAYYQRLKIAPPPREQRRKYMLWELMQIFGRDLWIGAAHMFVDGKITVRTDS